MSIGLITVAYGEKYLRFLPRWIAAAAELQRLPDDIVIVSDRYLELVHSRSQEIAGPITWITSEAKPERHAQILANEAIQALDTEWVCKMDVDDIIYPHALNPLDNCDADVFMFGISINGERELPARPVTAADILACEDNLLFAGSPFRRAVWEASSGFQDMLYDDWLFWREAAGNGFTFQASGTIDYEYTFAGHNATRDCDHEAEKERVFAHVH